MASPASFLWTCWLLVLALGSLPARAADAWIWFGESIPGESQDPRHKGWSDLLTVAATTDDDGLALKCVRPLDKATPLLMKACALNAEPLPQIRIELARESESGSREFWHLDLREVRVISCDYVGSGESEAHELLKLSWKSLRATYRVFPDEAESYAVSRLISVDGDRDGLPDAYEEEVGLRSGVSNLGKDSDRDGLLDIDEYRLGTNPSDSTSFFQVLAARSESDKGKLLLSWPSVPGESYRVEHSTNLLLPFTPFAQITASATETVHEVPLKLSGGFFRVSSGESP